VTPPRYSAEEREVDAVGDDLIRLWSGNLESMGADAPAKLDWYYRSSPYGRGRAVVLRAHGGAGDAVVGCQGIGFRRVRCDGRALRAALIADLAVERPHRGLFPALALVRRTREVAADAADFQYGFPNQLAVGPFRRSGYRDLGTMVRYARVLRHAPYLGRAIRARSLARAGGAVLDAVDGALRAVPRLAAAIRYRLDAAAAPDGRFDALFEEACRGHRVIGERGSDFLRWRFFGGRGAAELETLVRRGDGALRAYAVVRRQGDAAHLADFLAASEAELEALLRMLLAALRVRGCSSVSVRFLGTWRVVRLLERLRFRRREATRTVVFDAADPAVAALLGEAEGLYLTDADEDDG